MSQPTLSHQIAAIERKLRDVIVIVAAPHDDLVRRFVADLKQRGIPSARASQLYSLTGARITA